jgi:hypothetical protein
MGTPQRRPPPSFSGSAKDRRKARRAYKAPLVVWYWADDPPTLPQLADAARKGLKVSIMEDYAIPF